MTSLQGQRAWVIGASSGIGAEVARELDARGCTVLISARDVDGLQRVADGRMQVLRADFTDREGMERAAEQAGVALGGLDLVVIAAGFWERMDASTFDLDVFTRHIERNVLGMANAIASVLPRLTAQGSGTIVGISSVAGYRGMPGAQGYGASKAAQINLLESLRVGLAGTGVRVQTVCPGFVRTPMTASNTFPMPFIIDADVAARAIVRGIEDGRPEIVFPLPMAITMKLARLVPQRLWNRLMAPRSRGGRRAA